jgi:phosphinothricin acetyltransferase
MSGEVNLREAVPDDGAAVAAIYAHHVLHGTASYDTEAPSPAQMRDKIVHVLAQDWPFLVAEAEGEVVGYAYATQFRDRPAYAYTCENSIYVRSGHGGRGIGRRLLQALLVRAAQAGFRQMVAVIGGAEPASVALHAACGFRETGRIEAAGWKKGRWLDNVYMQKALGPGATRPPDG